jgi:hypothetical protein
MSESEAGEKYWFITYLYRCRGQDWHHTNGVRKKHPLVWLREMVERRDDYSYRILWYTEITEDQYVEIDGYIE